MHKPRLRPLLIVATMATAMAALATPGMADEIDDLKRQIKLLTQRIDRGKAKAIRIRFKENRGQQYPGSGIAFKYGSIP